MDALVIVDMQVASFADGAKHDMSGIVHRINVLSSFVRQAGGSVIFIQHDGTEQDGLVPDTPGWQVLPTLETRPGDLFVRKTMNDAVVVPCDAHTVSDRAHLTAPQIIDHHNRTWAGLIATPPVHVAPTAELLARVPEVS